jgi:hypothetical protein
MTELPQDPTGLLPANVMEGFQSFTAKKQQGLNNMEALTAALAESDAEEASHFINTLNQFGVLKVQHDMYGDRLSFNPLGLLRVGPLFTFLTLGDKLFRNISLFGAGDWVADRIVDLRHGARDLAIMGVEKGSGLLAEKGYLNENQANNLTNINEHQVDKALTWAGIANAVGQTDDIVRFIRRVVDTNFAAVKHMPMVGDLVNDMENTVVNSIAQGSGNPIGRIAIGLVQGLVLGYGLFSVFEKNIERSENKLALQVLNFVRPIMDFIRPFSEELETYDIVGGVAREYDEKFLSHPGRLMDAIGTGKMTPRQLERVMDVVTNDRIKSWMPGFKQLYNPLESNGAPDAKSGSIDPAMVASRKHAWQLGNLMLNMRAAEQREMANDPPQFEALANMYAGAIRQMLSDIVTQPRGGAFPANVDELNTVLGAVNNQLDPAFGQQALGAAMKYFQQGIPVSDLVGDSGKMPLKQLRSMEQQGRGVKLGFDPESAEVEVYFATGIGEKPELTVPADRELNPDLLQKIALQTMGIPVEQPPGVKAGESVKHGEAQLVDPNLVQAIVEAVMRANQQRAQEADTLAKTNAVAEDTQIADGATLPGTSQQTTELGPEGRQ